MENISTPIVLGQVLYYKYQGRNSPVEIKEYTVSKIGNKYFYVKENDRRKFDKLTLRYVDNIYNQNNMQLFISKQKIEDGIEFNNLYSKVKDRFQWNKVDVSLSQLREIAIIINLK